MHGLRLFEQVVFQLQAVAILLLIAKLMRERLFRTYRFFFWFLVWDALQFLLLSAVPRGTDLYGYVYLVTQAVLVCLSALVVLELYSIIFRDLKGIATLARRYIRVAIGLSILLSLVLLALEKTPSSILSRFFTFERAVISSLMLFVLMITAFLVYYPIPLNRNAIYYSMGYALYFTTKAAGLLLLNTGHSFVRLVSPISITVATICLIFWLISLNRAGEQKTMIIGHSWDREDEERVLQGLQTINASLMRMRKSS